MTSVIDVIQLACVHIQVRRERGKGHTHTYSDGRRGGWKQKTENENGMMCSVAAGSPATAAGDPGKILARPLPAMWL